MQVALDLENESGYWPVVNRRRPFALHTVPGNHTSHTPYLEVSVPNVLEWHCCMPRQVNESG